jgi:WD40 repeat protein
VATLTHKGAGDVNALAVVEGGALVSGGDTFICTWAQGADRGLKSIAGEAVRIAALPGGRFATAGGTTNLAEVWDAGTGARLHQLRGHTNTVMCVAALPGGLLASGSSDKTVRIWNVATGAHVSTLEGHTGAVCALAALPDGRLASGSFDKTIRLWNVATRDCTQVLQHPDWVRALAVLGGRLASGCADSRVYIWSLAGGVQEAVLEGHTGHVYSLAALSNGLLASGSRDKKVRVWNVETRECVAVLEGHGGHVHALAALPDGRLASGSTEDPLIRVWTLSAPGSPEDAAAATAEARRVVVAPAAEARRVVVAPAAEARRVVVASGGACTVCALANPDRTAACGAVAHAPVPRYRGGQLTARCVATLTHKGAGDVNALAVVEGGALVSGGDTFICAWAQGADRGLNSIEGKALGIAALPGGRFATAGWDTNLIEVWDAGTGARLHQLGGHTNFVWCVAALPGGLLASGSSDNTVRIWNAATGAHVSTLEGHTSDVRALAALPDGRLASGSEDKTIRLWNVATRACTQVLQHPYSVNALAVLDGGRLASGCGDNDVYIWSLAGGVQEAVLKGHTSYVLSLAALPNGLLASGSWDNTVRVWDVGARACVAVLEGDGRPVPALAALPDGRLASGSRDDPLIRVWTLSAPGSPEDAAAATAEARRVVVAPAPVPQPPAQASAAPAATPLALAPARSAPVPPYRGGQLTAHCVATLKHKGAGDVWALAVVEGGALVSGGDNLICAWAPGADSGLKSIAGKAVGIAALPGGRFATAGWDTNLIEVWDAGTGARLHQLRGHTGNVRCVAALPGGLLASGSYDKTVRIWNATTGAHVSTLEGHTNWVWALAALPDGRLASGSFDNTIRLWNVATRDCTQVLQHPEWVRALAVLDGGRLASGCGDNVYIWSLAGGVQEAVLEGHTFWVCSLAALPNGLLASGSEDKTVRVWDVGARACVAVLEGHEGSVVALAALPDGRLASGCLKGPLIRVWTLTAPGSPEDAAAAAAEARGRMVLLGGGGKPTPQQKLQAIFDIESNSDTKTYCDTVLTLLLIDMKRKMYDFDANKFMKKIGTSLGDIKPCPVVFHILKVILDEGMKQVIDSNAYIFSPQKSLNYTEDTFQNLEKRYAETFDDSEKEAFENMTPIRYYHRTPEEFRDLLGDSPYILSGHSEDAEPELRGVDVDGLYDEPLRMTADEKNLLTCGGIPLGAIIFMYITAVANNKRSDLLKSLQSDPLLE